MDLDYEELKEPERIRSLSSLRNNRPATARNLSKTKNNKTSISQIKHTKQTNVNFNDFKNESTEENKQEKLEELMKLKEDQIIDETNFLSKHLSKIKLIELNDSEPPENYSWKKIFLKSSSRQNLNTLQKENKEKKEKKEKSDFKFPKALVDLQEKELKPFISIPVIQSETRRKIELVSNKISIHNINKTKTTSEKEKTLSGTTQNNITK